MRVIEVCCGAGGMSLGLKRAGFNIDRAIDVSDSSLRVYRQNIPTTPSLLSRRHHAHNGDLADLLSLVPSVLSFGCDLIAGGPPHYDVSSVRYTAEGKRADLTLGFAIFVAAIRPQWLFMESSPKARKSLAWSQARAVLKRAGYGLTETIVNACQYGSGQAGKRFIVIGRLNEADEFFADAIKDAANSTLTTVRDILGDDVGVHPGGNFPPETRVFFARPFKNGRGVRSIDEPCPAIFRTSGNWAPKNWPRHKDDIAPPRKVPPLTYDQLARLQGFPEDWSWEPMRTVRDRDQMIANAMPVPLAEALGRLILARAKGENLPSIEAEFVEWLGTAKKLTGPALRNRKTHLNRARRLLKGRILADLDAELALLQRSKGFENLPTSTKSDLRLALRLHWEWREQINRSQRNIEFNDPHPVSNCDAGGRSQGLASLTARTKRKAISAI